MNLDVYPEKAQYLTGEPVRILVESDESAPDGCMAVLNLCRLDEIVLVKEQPFAGRLDAFDLGGFNESFAGFGVKITILRDNIEQQSTATAFDVVSKHSDIIRYGFLSDFDTSDRGCDDVETLRKYHINMVQYYDWSFRHDDLVSSTDNYADMMGRRIDLKVVRQKIAACRKYGMKSLGYGAVYAASKSFYESHPDWGLYTSADEPLVFIDVFYIMNVAGNCPWHGHIINEYRKAVSEVGFDGIHMDTYGFPKTAFSKMDGKKELVRLDEEYPGLIENTKTALNQITPDNHLIFNNVGNWPVTTVANAPQDAVYIEVWEPYTNYSHIKQIITDAKRACQNRKPVILAAYLAPFRTDTPERAENAALLLTAAIAANGASSLLLGEKNAVLTQGYYVDHSFLADRQTVSMRNYYDFIVRYMELLYDQTLEDVSFTHTGWDNTEYRCLNKAWSVDGRPETIWLTIRENTEYKCISLINLCGCGDGEWNSGKNTPQPQRDVCFRIQLDTAVESICFASPDSSHGDSERIPYRLETTDRGIIAEFSIPCVDYWGMVNIKLAIFSA